MRGTLSKLIPLPAANDATTASSCSQPFSIAELTAGPAGSESCPVAVENVIHERHSVGLVGRVDLVQRFVGVFPAVVHWVRLLADGKHARGGRSGSVRRLEPVRGGCA